MQTIVYALHIPESHALIAERIKKEKPDIYLDESPEKLDEIYNKFLLSTNSTISDLEKELSKLSWKEIIKERGLDKILEELKAQRIKRVGIENEEILLDYSKFQADKVIPVMFSLYLDKSSLASSKFTNKLAEQDPLFDLFISQDDEKTKNRLSKGFENLYNNLKEFANKEIERDNYLAKMIKELSQPNMFAYFGYSHRTISHILRKDNLVIPSELIGALALNPEEKLTLLLKYELLGLDTEELRSEDISYDCDKSQKQFYLDIMPEWFGFYDINKNRKDVLTLTKVFWDNLNKIVIKL